MTTASKVRAIYTAPAATPTTQPTNQTSEHAIVKAWLRKMLIKLIARVLIACFFVGVGVWIESKYHITGAATASIQSAKKGGK